MSKQVLGLIIISLVFLFPFRMVYLEYPETVTVNNTVVDGGGITYVIMFLAVIFGFLAFLFMNTEDAKKH
jgi:hypothetical protein